MILTSKNRLFKFFGIVVCLLACARLAQAQPAPRAAGNANVRFARGHILVKFRSDILQDRISDVLAVQGVQDAGEIPNIGVHILNLPPGAIEGVYVHAFQEQPEVEFAEVDQILAPSSITPNDPYYPSQWALPDISLPNAWSTTTGSSSVVIAILDTGVNAVADLPSTKFVAGCDTFDDPNCLSPSTNIPDVSGHGTETAGAAAAVGNNGIGVASPCWGCSIMPVRVTDATGNAWVSAVATGLTWAASHGAKVAYVGFAVDSSATVMAAAQTFYNNAGVVVMPAGNSGYETSPASPYAIVVSGVNSNNVIDPASSYGNDVDLAAPFTDITTGPTSGTYGQVSGTSFSAALVAGVGGLVLSKNSCLSATQVTSILQQTATPLGVAQYYGSGLVNASGAVTLAATMPCISTKINTTTSLASSLNPSTFGQLVTLTATVSPSAATGTVRFLDGGVSLGTASLSGGSASLSTSALAAGAHSITASYNGDTNYATSTSSAITQTVNKASTSTSLTSNLNPSNSGQSVTFTAIVSPSAATGTVTFFDGASSLGTVAVSSGSAALSTSSLTVGTHSISATYNGGTNYNGSTSNTVSQTVNPSNKTNTTTSLTSSLNPSPSGQTVTFTATVSPSAATGTVTFVDGASTLGTVALSSGIGRYSTSSLAVGTHSIKATYNGDSNYNGSTSSIVSQTVNSDTTPPTAPTNLTSLNMTKSQVTLSWRASTDNVGVTGYRIFRTQLSRGKGSGQIGTSTTTGFVDTSGKSGASYAYTVYAFDAAGNVSAASNTLTVTVP